MKPHVLYDDIEPDRVLAYIHGASKDTVQTVLNAPVESGEDIFDLMGMHILITGNPVDGFERYGPFKTGEDAIAAGEDRLDGDWWIAPLRGKEELE